MLGATARGIALLATLSAASCGFGVAPPSLTIPLGMNDWGTYSLLVYDGSGLVIDGRSLERRPPGPDPDGVVAVPERQELEIRWTGGACSHRPSVQIAGSAADLSIVLSNPPDEQLFPVACPAVGIPFGVTLLLGQPVAQADVALDVR